MRNWRAFAALALALSGCSSSTAVTGTSTTAGTTIGGTSGGTTTGGGTSTGGSASGTTGGSPDSGVLDSGVLTNTVNGPFGFKVVSAGLLYNLTPGSQPDLTVVDSRLTDGVYPFPMCANDGGDTNASENSLDLYLFNSAPVYSLSGTYAIAPLSDAGGVYAALYRAQRDLDAGLLFTLQASDGTVQCVGSASGIAGTFQATFDLDGGLSTISGTFNTPYCGPLSGN